MPRTPMPTRPPTRMPARAHAGAPARPHIRAQARTQARPHARTAAHIATALVLACLCACATQGNLSATTTADATGTPAAAPADTRPPPDPATYAQLGGAAGVEGIVDDLLLAILEDDRINLQFADADIIRLRGKLIEQLCAESGGPCTYTGLTMHESHAGRGIDHAQFNALVENLIDVMTARGVPVGAQNRLLKRLAPMHRDIVEK